VHRNARRGDDFKRPPPRSRVARSWPARSARPRPFARPKSGLGSTLYPPLGPGRQRAGYELNYGFSHGPSHGLSHHQAARRRELLEDRRLLDVCWPATGAGSPCAPLVLGGCRASRRPLAGPFCNGLRAAARSGRLRAPRARFAHWSLGICAHAARVHCGG